MPTSIEAQGHTVDEAIQIALNQLGVSRDKVEIEIVHHPRRGVLGIGARRAKVRATIRESVMLDGEEFDMSGGSSLDDKPRRRRRRGGRSRGGAREDGTELADSPGPSRAPARTEGGRESGRQEGGRGRDDAGRSREGRRDDRRGGRGRGGDRPGDGQQRSGQQQVARDQQRGGGQQGRGGQDRQERQDRPDRQDRPERSQERGQERGQERRDRQDRRGDRRDGGRDDRSQRGQQPAASPSSQGPVPSPAAPEPARAERSQPAFENALEGPPHHEAIAAPEEHAALPAASRRAPAVEEPPLDAAALEAIRVRAEELVRELLGRMGFAAEISSSIDEAAGEAVVSVRSDSEGLLIGRRGQTLDSLEHIVNRMVLRGEAFAEGRVQLDIGDYRKRRRESLEELAGRLRARAVTEKRTVQVSPMSPRDRKYFGQAFALDDAVEVRALGAGFYRRVIVAPAGMGSAAAAAAEAAGGDDEGADFDTASGAEAEN